MSRVFAYCRVSKDSSHTDNQKIEIKAAGFHVVPTRCIEEVISGSVPSAQRPGFQKLLDRLEAGDVLVVTKMDRLGRNAMDVRATIDHLKEIGVRVHCLQLGGADLTSAAGKMIMQVINAHAEFERDLLVERTRAGLERVKGAGKRLGRKPALDDVQKGEVINALLAGTSVAAVSRQFKTTRQTILRIRKAWESSQANASD
ncbi:MULTISPECIES: recombinase family protein [unclassified Pantoea]|uniref:recombinase family protein n=1 Tax=unclassified Pantoea TaxID=2630326 RepID=UPI0012321DB5|nr:MULTISPECIES: recombinase family protein [unclassified Pantoea]KAA6093901.1 recombinase family protein [Pantoea sp. B_9]KAA6106526.1 recombinase family protein [Pantoea sp. B_10]